MSSEAAQARRYYHHVLHGGSLSAKDVARMVESIERKDQQILDLKNEAEAGESE